MYPGTPIMMGSRRPCVKNSAFVALTCLSACAASYTGSSPGTGSNILIYSPYSGSQPSLVAVELPHSMRDASKSHTETQTAISDKSADAGPYSTDLELQQIAIILTGLLRSPLHDLTAEKLVARIRSDRTPSAAFPDAPFPSRMFVNHASCHRVGDDHGKFLAARLCIDGVDGYDEFVAQDFGQWSSITNVGCLDCVHRYSDRQFRLDTLRLQLREQGYTSVGPIASQTLSDGFWLPSYDGFVRDKGLLVLARTNRTPLHGGPTDDELRVSELRVYFPVKTN